MAQSTVQPSLTSLNQTQLNCSELALGVGSPDSGNRSCLFGTPDNTHTTHTSTKVKTFHMHYNMEGREIYLRYDPIIGIQTGGILGTCLLLVMCYFIYKAWCRRKPWTSLDQLYMNQYKRKLERGCSSHAPTAANRTRVASRVTVEESRAHANSIKMTGCKHDHHTSPANTGSSAAESHEGTDNMQMHTLESSFTLNTKTNSDIQQIQNISNMGTLQVQSEDYMGTQHDQTHDNTDTLQAPYNVDTLQGHPQGTLTISQAHVNGLTEKQAAKDAMQIQAQDNTDSLHGQTQGSMGSSFPMCLQPAYCFYCSCKPSILPHLDCHVSTSGNSHMPIILGVPSDSAKIYSDPLKFINTSKNHLIEEAPADEKRLSEIFLVPNQKVYPKCSKCTCVNLSSSLNISRGCRCEIFPQDNLTKTSRSTGDMHEMKAMLGCDSRQGCCSPVMFSRRDVDNVVRSASLPAKGGEANSELVTETKDTVLEIGSYQATQGLAGSIQRHGIVSPLATQKIISRITPDKTRLLKTMLWPLPWWGISK